MSASDWAAWTGAVAGLLALAWEVIRWRREGPRLRLHASATMRLIPDTDPRPILMVWVTNTGTSLATLTSFTLHTFPTRWSRIRFRPSQSWVTGGEFAVGGALPHELQPGQQWMAGVRQDPPFVKHVTSGQLWIGIHYAASDKPALRRVPTTATSAPKT